MLILLGAANLAGVMTRVRAAASHQTGSRESVHSHAPSHGDYVHSHPHGHEPERHPHQPDRTPLSWLDRHLGAGRASRLVRPLLVGVVHGLAGSAAVALLALTTIRSPAWSLAYLVVFGAGTIIGMMLITAAIALPMVWSAARFDRVSRGLRLASGLASLALGLFLAYRIGVVDGLFGPTPRWDPH
jgi:high-affinity nickel-transport protein